MLPARVCNGVANRLPVTVFSAKGLGFRHILRHWSGFTICRSGIAYVLCTACQIMPEHVARLHLLYLVSLPCREMSCNPCHSSRSTCTQPLCRRV